MSKNDPIDPAVGPLNPISARNRVAFIHSLREAPTREVEQAARNQLATAKIDKAIRDAMDACDWPLHPAQVEYLKGRIDDAGRKPAGA